MRFGMITVKVCPDGHATFKIHTNSISRLDQYQARRDDSRTAPPSSGPRPGLHHLTVEIGEAHDEEDRGDEAAGGHDINDIIVTHLVANCLALRVASSGTRCYSLPT